MLVTFFRCSFSSDVCLWKNAWRLDIEFCASWFDGDHSKDIDWCRPLFEVPPAVLSASPSVSPHFSSKCNRRSFVRWALFSSPLLYGNCLPFSAWPLTNLSIWPLRLSNSSKKLFRLSVGWSGTSLLILVIRFDLVVLAHGILLVIGRSGSLSVKNVDDILLVDFDVKILLSFPDASPFDIFVIVWVSLLKPFGSFSSFVVVFVSFDTFLSISFVLLLLAKSVFIVESMNKWSDNFFISSAKFFLTITSGLLCKKHVLSEARRSTGLYLGDRKLFSRKGGGSRSSSSKISSGELPKELLGEGEQPPIEDRSQLPFIRQVISCDWLSKTYGELGCSLHRSTKSRRLSLATSSSCLGDGWGSGGLSFCIEGRFTIHRWRKHSVAVGRDLRQRPLLLSPQHLESCAIMDLWKLHRMRSGYVLN